MALRTVSPLSGPLLCPGALLLDHFIRQKQERRGKRHAESLGRLEVQDQLELHRLLYRQVGRLSTFQDLV